MKTLKRFGWFTLGVVLVALFAWAIEPAAAKDLYLTGMGNDIFQHENKADFEEASKAMDEAVKVGDVSKYIKVCEGQDAERVVIPRELVGKKMEDNKLTE
jgi:hypothetical protein